MIAGLLLISIILISGTFAFQQFNQGAFNPAWADEVYLVGGRVHDDFEDREGPGEYNKDIFAENFGERDLFVRIQLREFLSIDDDAIGQTDIGLAVINNPQTWPLYQADEYDATLRRAGTYTFDIGDEGIVWTLGHPDDDVPKIFMPTHNHATLPVLVSDILPTVPPPFNSPNAYRFSNTTGRGIEALAALVGEFDINAQLSAEDIHSAGLQTGATISDGTHNFWALNQPYTSNLIYINDDGELTIEAGVTHFARETLVPDEGGVMTLAEWNALGQPEGNFWIMDTENPGSWFYWNGYLAAGEATSLLLNDIFIPDRQEAWQYVIHMNADFFTAESIDDLPGGISEGAREIFERPSIDTAWLSNPDYLCSALDRNWVDSRNIAWCILELADIEGNGGYGNALIITVDAFGGSNHNSIVPNIDAWFAANGAPELNQIGMNTMIPPERGISTDPATGENTFMIPDPATVGSARAFPLSRVESDHYFPSNAARSATDSVTGNARGWWLRSGASLSGANLHQVTGTGAHTFNNAGSQVGMRPALWVQQ